jgi:hypothetical protein
MLCAGWAVAAFFGYMKGVANELAIRHVKEVVPHNDTLAGPWGRRGDQVGFSIHISPHWAGYGYVTGGEAHTVGAASG